MTFIFIFAVLKPMTEAQTTSNMLSTVISKENLPN